MIEPIECPLERNILVQLSDQFLGALFDEILMALFGQRQLTPLVQTIDHFLPIIK